MGMAYKLCDCKNRDPRGEENFFSYNFKENKNLF